MALLEEDRHFTGYCPSCGQKCHCDQCVKSTVGHGYFWANQSKKEIVEALGLDKRGQFDYALPQQWVDDFTKVTGMSPMCCFVWFYPNTGEGSLIGFPYPLTDAGRWALKVYNTKINSSYPIY